MIPTDLFEAWQHAPMVHAIIVHLPIALAVLGVPLAFFSVVFVRSHALRAVAVASYLLLIAGAYAAVQTGERARREVPPTISTEVSQLLDTHERMAENVWIFAAVTAILLLLTFVRARGFQVAMGMLAVIASLSTAGWVALVGHHGGTLVYSHGVGTPAMTVSAPPAEDPAPEEEALEPGDELIPPPPPVPDANVPPLPPIDPEEAEGVSFSRDIVPIFEEFCVSCHRSGKSEGEFDLTTYDRLLAGGHKSGPAVIPRDPDNSPLVRYIRGLLQPQMPKDDLPIPEEDLHLIRLWIAAGAVDDSVPRAEPGILPPPRFDESALRQP